MKTVFIFAILLLGPIVFAAPQTSSAETAPQASNDGHSHSGRATSHDRHARKHHASNHHRRPRTTAKNHSS
jgi:hypothetical protein